MRSGELVDGEGWGVDGWWKERVRGGELVVVGGEGKGWGVGGWWGGVWLEGSIVS